MLQTPDPNLQICNRILLGSEQRDIERAARFAEAGRHDAAEHIREQHGYSARDLRADINKVGATR